MTIEDPETRTRETLIAGLIKGRTACNRTACQRDLTRGRKNRWWNRETRAWYCYPCAFRINDACTQFDPHISALCTPEGDRTVETDEVKPKWGTEPWYRSSHEVVCELCGQLYGKHPQEWGPGYGNCGDEKLILHRICNGDLIKP